MKVLDKILANLTNIWNALPKDVPALIISQGTGQYPYVSVDAGSAQMYFHAGTYYDGIPAAQVITLDGYTLDQLRDVINSMGYVATLTSEDPTNDNDYSVKSSASLMEVYNQPLTPATLSVFTASTWKFLYPIARAVSEWERNTGDSIPQLVATLATGTWLDYWATFFTTQRTSGETDNSLRTRIFMNLANLKTNNVALAELVAFAVKGKVTVKDVSPGLFEIDIDPSYMNTAADVHNIIRSGKAGGIKYYLNYTGLYNYEDYRAAYKTVHGVDFANSDVVASTSVTRTVVETEPYGSQQINFSLTLGRDAIGTDPTAATLQLIPNPRFMTDVATMTLTQNGIVLRSGDPNRITYTYHNELQYTPSTWAEWSKNSGGAFDSTGASITADGSTWQNIWLLNTQFKTSTKYGLLYNVVSNTLTQPFDIGSGVTAFTDTSISKTVGNNKFVVTSQSSITTNECLFHIMNTEPAGNSIKIKDIRVFELPPGSQIETDFNTLTADQLASKYPMQPMGQDGII